MIQASTQRFLLLLFITLLPLTSAKADYTYIVETFDPWDFSEKEYFNVDEAVDGVDPISYHRIYSIPQVGYSQILWQGTDKTVVWDKAAGAVTNSDANFEMIVDAKLPAGGEVRYSVWSIDNDAPVHAFNHNRSESPWGVDLTEIADLPAGNYELHATLRTPNAIGFMRDRTVYKQQLRVVDEYDVIEPPEIEFPVEEDSSLAPGNGFDGPTAQPGPIGNRTTNTMARWDVVPEQTFNGAFEVGVVAFHSYGMDRVELSFNGGPWRKIHEPSLNPRTKVQEYWATINAQDVPDGKVEVRAIAYPKAGTPRVLPTLVLFANAGGTVKFPVIELDAGHHVIPHGLDLPTEGWLTIRPKPGVKKEDCIVYGIGRHSRGGHIKIEGLTIRVGESSRGAGNWGWLWMDDVDYTGKAYKVGEELTWWISDHQWDRKFFTDMKIRQLQTAFHTCGDGIIRNVELDTIYEDVVRQAGLIVNMKVDNVSGGASRFHPDLFQWYGQNPTNMIVYNFTAKDVQGQGLFPGDLTDCAFVDLNLNIVGQYRPLQMQGKTRNVLIQDSNLAGDLGGVLRYDKGFSPEDVVFRNLRTGPDGALPSGWQHHGISVEPAE